MGARPHSSTERRPHPCREPLRKEAAPARMPAWRVGCAGWSIPRHHADDFPEAGSHLQRYARVFDAVEIDSSFYRNHRPATYRRWAAAVPDRFRFSVKFPRSITHEARLRDCDDLLQAFLAGVDELGPRLGGLLLQLPPRLHWDPSVVGDFLGRLRDLHRGPVACEPRHVSWFAAEVDRTLRAYRVARVAADPGLCPRARVPGGDGTVEYLRLHGSPRRYYDRYGDDALDRLADRLRRPARGTAQRWCIFDNTALGHATENALALLERLSAA